VDGSEDGMLWCPFDGKFLLIVASRELAAIKFLFVRVQEHCFYFVCPCYSSLRVLQMFCILFQSNTKANLTALPILPTPSTGGSSRQFASFSLSKRTRALLLCSVCSLHVGIDPAACVVACIRELANLLSFHLSKACSNSSICFYKHASLFSSNLVHLIHTASWSWIEFALAPKFWILLRSCNVQV
jgi:hypothetical protein